MDLFNFPHAIARADGRIEDTCGDIVPWWSLSKSVLAAAVLRLADKGGVALDAPYQDWPFTPRQLLQHTSGLTNYGDQDYQDAVLNGDPVWPEADLLERTGALKLRFAPGTGWAYSNIGYLLLRRLIEQKTGQDLGEALARLVLEPAGMADTGLAETPEELEDTLWGNPAEYDPAWVYHGLLVGTPGDAVRFFRALMAGKLVSAAALAAMQQAYPVGAHVPHRPWTSTGYGLGLMIGEMKGCGRVLGHSGVGPASVAAAYAFTALPGCPVVAVFAEGADEGIAEHEAVRLALKG